MRLPTSHKKPTVDTTNNYVPTYSYLSTCSPFSTTHETRHKVTFFVPSPSAWGPSLPPSTDECSHLASADILINHKHKVMTSSPYHENLQSIPVRITNRNYNKSQITPSTTYSSLITVPFKTQKKTFVPKILLTNLMSLTPKIDEVL